MMRENPPGKMDWTEAELDAKSRYNERKLQALTSIRELGEYFGSSDIAANLGITRKYASMILLRLKRQGLVVPVEDMRVIPPGAGRDPIIYTGTEQLAIREQLLRVKVGFRATKEQGARQRRSLEL